MNSSSTSNDESAESGYYFAIALHKHNPHLPVDILQRRCASEAIFWSRKRYSWLNTEVFVRKAIETYDGQSTLCLMRG